MLYNAIVKGDRARLRRSLLAVFDALYQRMESEASENEHKEEKEEIAVREN